MSRLPRRPFAWNCFRTIRHLDPAQYAALLPVTDPAGTIVAAGHPGLVDTVLVAGRVVKRDGVLVDVDLRALRTRLLESRDRVAAAAGIPLDGTSAAEGGVTARAGAPLRSVHLMSSHDEGG
ncbi:hypothetical protein ACFVW1_28990 [Streptomyces olivochromogenes]|uniref:hypothetical protein n=1 Tax=Streptomyces olivochromogenes TaxID=1963 RepID=UPI0036DB6043